jgi:hypothetical protein
MRYTSVSKIKCATFENLMFLFLRGVLAIKRFYFNSRLQLLRSETKTENNSYEDVILSNFFGMTSLCQILVASATDRWLVCRRNCPVYTVYTHKTVTARDFGKQNYIESILASFFSSLLLHDWCQQCAYQRRIKRRFTESIDYFRVSQVAVKNIIRDG